MPRAANGTYTLPVGNPVVTNTPISSTVQNTTMSDVAAALSDSLSRSGLGGMLAPLPFIAGTVNAPGFTWSTELVSGFYLAATNDMRAGIAGNDIFRFSAAGVDVYNGLQGSFYGPGQNGQTTLKQLSATSFIFDNVAGGSLFDFRLAGISKLTLTETYLSLAAGQKIVMQNTGGTNSRGLQVGAGDMVVETRGALAHWASAALVNGNITVQTTTPGATGSPGAMVFVYE